jgi:hypothetical protein
VNLALAIIFLWLGAALLVVAFHPLTGTGASPGAVVNELQAKVANAT